MMFNKKEMTMISIILCLLLFSAGLVVNYYQGKEEIILQTKGEKDIAGDEVKETASEIVIHIGGLVNKPGVYSLVQGQRVVDALNLAGGARAEADLDQINLAAVLLDGQKIVIPEKISLEKVSSKHMTNQEHSLININSANVEDLDTLPGIGPALAERIVEYRESQGNFASIEDLNQVAGIGQKKLEDLKDKVTLY